MSFFFEFFLPLHSSCFFLFVVFSRQRRRSRSKGLDATAKTSKKKEDQTRAAGVFSHTKKTRHEKSRRSPEIKKKRTLLRLDRGLDGRDSGVGAELEGERAVCFYVECERESRVLGELREKKKTRRERSINKAVIKKNLSHPLSCPPVAEGCAPARDSNRLRRTSADKDLHDCVVRREREQTKEKKTELGSRQ